MPSMLPFEQLLATLRSKARSFWTSRTVKISSSYMHYDTLNRISPRLESRECCSVYPLTYYVYLKATSIKHKLFASNLPPLSEQTSSTKPF